jgi:hypothetical protein
LQERRSPPRKREHPCNRRKQWSSWGNAFKILRSQLSEWVKFNPFESSKILGAFASIYRRINGQKLCFLPENLKEVSIVLSIPQKILPSFCNDFILIHAGHDFRVGAVDFSSHFSRTVSVFQLKVEPSIWANHDQSERVFVARINYDQKSSPTHFSEDSKSPFRNSLLPEAARLQEEMGDISPVHRQVRIRNITDWCLDDDKTNVTEWNPIGSRPGSRARSQSVWLFI